MAGTTRTTVYLDDAIYRRLKALARMQDRTAAELIREAIAWYVENTPSAAPESPGAGRSGRGDLAERAEDLLSGLGGEAPTR